MRGSLKLIWHRASWWSNTNPIEASFPGHLLLSFCLVARRWRKEADRGASGLVSLRLVPVTGLQVSQVERGQTTTKYLPPSSTPAS